MFIPEFEGSKTASGYKVTLLGVTYGNGRDLPEASNDMFASLFDVSVDVFRSQLISIKGYDHEMQAWLRNIGDLALQGKDIKKYVLDHDYKISGFPA